MKVIVIIVVVVVVAAIMVMMMIMIIKNNFESDRSAPAGGDGLELDALALQPLVDVGDLKNELN